MDGGKGMEIFGKGGLPNSIVTEVWLKLGAVARRLLLVLFPELSETILIDHYFDKVYELCTQ